MPIIKGKLLNQLTHVALRTQVYHRRWRIVNMYAGFCDMSAGNAEVPLSIDKESCIIKTKDQVPLSCRL